MGSWGVLKTSLVVYCTILLNVTGFTGQRVNKVDHSTVSSNANQNDQSPVRLVAKASIVNSKGCNFRTCRVKRDDDFSVHVTLQTSELLFSHQINTSDVINLKLQSSYPNIVSPNFKLVVRGEDQSQILFNSTTLSKSDCHFTGNVVGLQDSKAAISICDNNLNGIIRADHKNFVIESLNKDHPEYHQRVRREAFDLAKVDDRLVLIYQSKASGGECGLKTKNLQRLRAPATPIVLLNTTKEVRMKREADKPQKTIELAVFVDEVLYKSTKDKGVSDPISNIQDIVFTYINSVQILYHTTQLDIQIRFVLVRLEVFTAAQRDLEKKGGEIEGYLESFCKWQLNHNPLIHSSNLNDPEHWDHGLLLTGMNLFDGKPEYDSVIGLAWVSGMCNPAYSCTINEGSNFESVFVIAHEMGHNLGMNHDGEKKEGNMCDPDHYLMSPVLGPGKVTWSVCSNRELSQFLTNHPQTACLENQQIPLPRYDYLLDGRSPGEKYNAYAQCQLAFGTSFKPHLKEESPFENLCRELWCANSTHALRAHPALEGTDCSAKPYPYGSHCSHGSCVPFYPSGVKEIDNSIDNVGINKINFKGIGSKGLNGDWVDHDRPVWYDPIFTEIFTNLKNRVSIRYQIPTP